MQHAQFESFRANVSELDVSEQNTHFFGDYPAVWTPKTCDEIRAFLLDAHRTAAGWLRTLEALEPEGDDYDRRLYHTRLEEMNALKTQLMSIVKLLVRCIADEIALHIDLVEAG